MTSITFFITFIPILSIILLFVNLVLAPHNPYQEKDSAFECGFHSFLGQNRTQFNISFFIFGLLFLLFDLEILLVYPYSVSSYGNDIYGLAIMMVFFILLTLGFVFELGKNALSIDSKQIFIFKNKDKSNLQTFTKFTINSMIISNMRRKDILAEIKGLNEDLKILRKAERLDNILTDKSKNSEMIYIMDHFSSFFDEESGNTRKEGITEVKNYLKEEILKYKTQIGEGSSKTTEDTTTTEPSKELSKKPSSEKLTLPFVISPITLGSSIVNYLLALLPNISGLFVIVRYLLTLVPLTILLLLSHLNLADLVPDIKPYYIDNIIYYLVGIVNLSWMIIPALILVLIAFSCFKLLYLMDEVTDSSLSAIASVLLMILCYEYPDFSTSDSYFIFRF